MKLSEKIMEELDKYWPAVLGSDIKFNFLEAVEVVCGELKYNESEKWVTPTRLDQIGSQARFKLVNYGWIDGILDGFNKLPNGHIGYVRQGVTYVYMFCEVLEDE